ncbi:carbohydrate ABC transporter membrane protein 1 (CUT1 family) [Rathayibacter sp. PhB93]|uniref:carbohydrate ABC transporter permease n=1 Tax=unclassified Rathayibacter TaxID=2609250 RepID=UPI000F49317B|nr:MULTISPECIES: sugar ABC transporter permease [unclassified Rathayibacter]ROQ03705.1 carbohydrate ABC transporter membrane protein 1 (CUT1 family) [Rathayibacter sp. PhB93]TDQ10729.1 carbohydrate ABC transporter membrane protein 1 (CUT1 family) [Rathayibacter sp. PhB1]
MTTTAAPRTGRPSTLAPRAAPWFFVAPAVLLAVALLALPLLYTVWLSFRGNTVSGSGLGVKKETFVGFDNYARTLADPALWAGFGRMLTYALLSVPVTMILALVFALLLDNLSTRFGRFSRIAIFVPYAVPGVIAALMWGFLYLPGVSPFVDAATALGLPAPIFLGPDSVFLSVANIAIWGSVGFNMVILYTSLRGLPSEIYDAARIDGCSERQLALRIKLPLIVPGVIMTGLFSVIGALQVFSEPNTLVTLTTVIGSDWVPMMLIYRDAFVTNDLFSASATSVVVTLLTLIASLGLLRFLQSRAFGED